MKKPLIAVFLLVSNLPLGCSSKDVPPDPLATREGFCEAWAENACQDKVVENCNANSVDDCKSAQKSFCLDNAPKNYSSKHAGDCLDAVKAAYADASLSPDDIDVVIKLGAPCDQLSTGTSGDGDACTVNDDCNTADGYACIIKGDATDGTCGKPDVVAAGDDCSGATQVCGTGYFCNAENCVVYKKTGASCEADYQCKPSDHCAEAAADPTMHTCQARLPLNETCKLSSDCASTYCAIAPGDTMGECASTIVLSRTEPLCKSLR